MAPKTIRGFAAVYALLFFVVVGSAAGAYATYNMHGVKKTVAHVQASLGETDAVKVAEQNVAASAQSQGLTLTSQKITKVVPDPKDPNTVRVYDSIGTVEAGPINLVVTVTKGVWQVASVAVAA